MKRLLTCWFDDGSHAKIALDASDPLGAALLHLARKRELSTPDDYMLCDEGGRELDLTAKISALQRDSVWLKSRLVARGQSAFCAFCGMEGDGLVSPGAQFGLYHPYCFKCVQCFAAFKPGDKVFAHPSKRAIVCEKCIGVIREAKLCRCGESVRGELVVKVGDEHIHVECM